MSFGQGFYYRLDLENNEFYFYPGASGGYKCTCPKSNGDPFNGCSCANGFDGDNCENNIDDCPAINPCQNGGTCVDGINNFTCSCVNGFDGDNCENNIDDCPAMNPCQNGGTCVDGINNFTCSCVNGFNGGNCENIDNCPTINPCQNGGKCKNLVNSYVCENCNPGWTGMHCGQTDECWSSPCPSGRVCVDGGNSFSCVCPAWFSGDNCTVFEGNGKQLFISDNVFIMFLTDTYACPILGPLVPCLGFLVTSPLLVRKP